MADLVDVWFQLAVHHPGRYAMADQVENLMVWQKAVSLVKMVYQLTVKFPKDEVYGLTSQIRRAAVSIPANIAEGRGRNHEKEFLQFLYIARGSTYELSTLLVLAKEVGFLSVEEYEQSLKALNEVASMINGLINAVKNNRNKS
jgi:four helix bundle protein